MITLRLYGQHGFVSNGYTYRTVEDAESTARSSFAINPSLIGAEVREDGKVVAKLFPSTIIEKGKP